MSRARRDQNEAELLARKIVSPDPLPDGLVDLPPGKIAAVATYLDMKQAPALPPGRGVRPGRPALPGSMVPLGDDLRRYRAIYGLVGEPWLWFSRSLLPDDRLRAIIEDPAVEALALHADGRDLGLVELDFRKAGECELAFFGLAPDACGRGIGAALMAEAIARAFARPIARLWLHTCTLDHPAALPFYLKCGFRPYRRAIEIADDPRILGHLPREAGPLFPTV